MLVEALVVLEQHGRAGLAEWFVQHFDTDLTLTNRAAALEQRNQHLAVACELAGSVRALAMHCNRFAADVWPRVRWEQQPPAHLTRLQAELFAAHKCGVGVPASKTQLAVVCSKKVSGPSFKPDSNCVRLAAVTQGGRK